MVKVDAWPRPKWESARFRPHHDIVGRRSLPTASASSGLHKQVIHIYSRSQLILRLISESFVCLQHVSCLPCHSPLFPLRAALSFTQDFHTVWSFLSFLLSACVGLFTSTLTLTTMGSRELSQDFRRVKTPGEFGRLCDVKSGDIDDSICFSFPASSNNIKIDLQAIVLGKS